MQKKKSGVMHFSQSVRIAIFILLFVVLLTVYVCLFQMIQQSAEADRQRMRELETIFTQTREKTDAQFSALYQIAASAHRNQTLRKVSMREYNVIDEMNAIDELEKLIAANIRKGVTVLGVAGSMSGLEETSDANATADDIKNGKTAYVNGKKVTGSHTDPAFTLANGVLSIV